MKCSVFLSVSEGLSHLRENMGMCTSFSSCCFFLFGRLSPTPGGLPRSLWFPRAPLTQWHWVKTILIKAAIIRVCGVWQACLVSPFMMWPVDPSTPRRLPDYPGPSSHHSLQIFLPSPCLFFPSPPLLSFFKQTFILKQLQIYRALLHNNVNILTTTEFHTFKVIRISLMLYVFFKPQFRKRMLLEGIIRLQRGGEGDRWKLEFLEEQLTSQL